MSADGVDARARFLEELELIQARIDKVVAVGRDAFGDGSDSYDIAVVAAVRLSALLEPRRFRPFLTDLSDDERRGIAATRNIAVHGAYRDMDDDYFWHTLTVDIPELLARFRAAGG